MDLDGFYEGDPRRGRSPEVRFGGHWLDESGYAYTIAWSEHTGELYAVRQVQHPDGPLLPFADPWVMVRPRWSDIQTEVFVLLTEPSRHRVDTLLDGWADLQGRPGAFEELIARLDKAGYPPPW